MEDAPVLIRTEGILGRITLNRPKALNALTRPMGEAILRALRDWAEAPAAKTVLIDAVPGRAFCAGGDMRAIHDLGKAGDPAALAFFATEYAMNLAIARFPKPYVALLDGVTMGGGAGLSVHGTFRVATENTLFAMPETALGFFPDVGGSYFLSRCPGALGIYLALTGARIGPADLVHTGLATHFIPHSRLAEIAPRLSLGEDAGEVLASLAGDAGESALARRRDAVDRAFACETVEGIITALAQEGAWGAEVISVLRTRSPTSLKLTLRQLREGASRNLAQCLEMEFAIAAEILKGHDFYEGVRAVLIDKDHAPKWRPARIEEVTDEDIGRYFPAGQACEPPQIETPLSNLR